MSVASGVDVGFEDARVNLPECGGLLVHPLLFHLLLELLQVIAEEAEGVGTLAIEREVAKVVHEARAADVEIEVGVDEALVNVQRLALSVTVDPYRLDVCPHLIVPETRAESFVFDGRQVDEDSDEASHILYCEVAAEMTADAVRD